MTRRPTLADVASAAGVAPSTASLAFSGGSIAPATRARILAAAEKLGYAGPDPVARSLRRRASWVVAVVLGDRLGQSFRDPVSIALLDGLAEHLSPHGLGMLLVPPQQDGVSYELLESAAFDIAVLVTCSGTDDPALTPLRRRGVPMVGVEGPIANDVHMVGLDDRAGTAQLTAHLRGMGHENIALVTLPFGQVRRHGPVPLAQVMAVSDVVHTPTRNRIQGVLDAGVTPTAVIETAGSLVDEGQRAARELLASPNRPTAIIAQSDILASGVVLAARELGLRVPQDLSVVGFDGVDLPWLAPDVLTTVSQQLLEKGRAAGQQVTRLLAGEVVEPIWLPVSLRLGTTSGPAPGV